MLHVKHEPILYFLFLINCLLFVRLTLLPPDNDHEETAVDQLSSSLFRGDVVAMKIGWQANDRPTAEELKSRSEGNLIGASVSQEKALWAN